MSRHGETQKTGYRQSGVDIDEGNRFISPCLIIVF